MEGLCSTFSTVISQIDILM